MKRKTIILAVVAAAAMALSLVGCGVKSHEHRGSGVCDGGEGVEKVFTPCPLCTAPTMLRP
mgnify:CR=1 FL=1